MINFIVTSDPVELEQATRGRADQSNATINSRGTLAGLNTCSSVGHETSTSLVFGPGRLIRKVDFKIVSTRLDMWLYIEQGAKF